MAVSRLKKAIDDVPELLGVGLYSVGQAAQLISFALNQRTSDRSLRRAALGRHEIERDYASIIEADLRIDGDVVFTFLQLIELLTVTALRQKGVRSSTIRRTRKVLQERYGSNPFARERFSTDGAGVYLAEIFRKANLLEELSSQQYALDAIVRPILSDVSYADDVAATYSPAVTHRTIVLNPARAFGAPINRNTGTPTYLLKAMLDAGETEGDVADWYGVTVEGVCDAYEYERALLQAA